MDFHFVRLNRRSSHTFADENLTISKECCIKLFTEDFYSSLIQFSLIYLNIIFHYFTFCIMFTSESF